ncbi:MAG: SDR family oxidoreductase, partial [Roseiflexaceae bacterium]|nr:SDR family oxidoreductase [Roseiflexaceae bacterium]
MKLNNATIFLTGANRGIGHALIEQLRQHGVRRIYAATRKPEAFKDIASDSLVPLKLDITDRRQVQAVAAQAHDTTVLINNAGALAFGSLLDSPLELIMRDMDTNYFGTLHMVRAFAPMIAQNGGGAIANLLSLVSLASMPSLGGYSASKAALFSLTQAIRAELTGKGIVVHGVYPGAVDTEMIAGLTLPKANPAEVAAAIVGGIANDVEDIYPGSMAQEMSQVWLQNPKQLEARFG